MLANVKDPVLKLLFAYEVARHQMTIPVNRFGWAVEPPQSIRDYSSDRALFIGKVYSAIVRLLGAGFPEEGNEGLDLDTSLNTFSVDFLKVAETKSLVKNQLVLLHMNFLGPAIVDRHIRPVKDRHGNPVKRANGVPVMELDLDPDSLTWEMLFETIPEILKQKDAFMEKFSQPPIGEPKRDHGHFSNRAKAIEHVIYEDHDFESEELDDEMEALAKRIKATRMRLTGAWVESRKRMAEVDEEAEGSSSKRQKSAQPAEITSDDIYDNTDDDIYPSIEDDIYGYTD
jgi:hypothetical protein